LGCTQNKYGTFLQICSVFVPEDKYFDILISIKFLQAGL